MAEQYPTGHTPPIRPVTPPPSRSPYPISAPKTSDSVGTILSDIVDNTQHLVRQEIALVQAEVKERIQAEARTKGVGIALFAAAGIFALIALGFLGWVLLYGFQEWFGWSGWLSALLVTIIYLAVAGILAFIGKNKFQSAPDNGEASTIPTP